MKKKIAGLFLILGAFIGAYSTVPAFADTINSLPQYIISKDEGTQLTPRTTSLNFTGAGVTATNIGNAVTVNVSGGSLSLLTNGIPNASQTILNLSQGSGMTITDIGGGIVEFAAVFSPAGSLGQIQFYDPSTNLMGGIPDSYSNSTGTYFNSGKLLITTDVSDRNKAGTFDAGLLDGIYTYNLPKGSGTLPLTVNGVSADDSGEITISAGIGGSGTTNEIAYFTGASTIGSLATATYPSLTELSYIKGVTSSIQTQLNAKGTGTVTSVAGSGGTTGLSFSGSPITTSGTLTLTGTLIAANGGTGFASYAVGDLLYANTTTTLAKLADVAVGSYLRSGGVTTAPLWSTLILPNAATTNRIPYATSTNTWGESASFTFDGANTFRYGSGVTGIIFQPNTSSSTFAAAYSTNVTPSNTNHFWRHNGVTTVINATSAGNLQLQNDNNSILTIGASSVVASKLMTVTDTVAGTALDVLNSTTSAAANGLKVTMSSAGHNAAQGIIVAKSTTSGGGNTLTMLDFQQNGQNATTSQEINHTYSLRDNSASRSAGAVSFKYSNTGSGTQVTGWTWRNLVGGTTLTDSMKLDGSDLKLLVAGGGLYVKEGTNATMGTCTLVAGTCTVSTTKVTANSRIFLTRQTTAGTIGTSMDVTARTAGTSFVITSNGSVLDTSVVAWMIVEPS